MPLPCVPLPCVPLPWTLGTPYAPVPYLLQFLRDRGPLQARRRHGGLHGLLRVLRHPVGRGRPLVGVGDLDLERIEGARRDRHLLRPDDLQLEDANLGRLGVAGSNR